MITGSTRGIGLSIAELLYSHGCRVVLNSRNSEELDQVVSKLSGSNGFVADVTDPIQANCLIDDILKSHGTLDCVVCMS